MSDHDSISTPLPSSQPVYKDPSDGSGIGWIVLMFIIIVGNCWAIPYLSDQMAAGKMFYQHQLSSSAAPVPTPPAPSPTPVPAMIIDNTYRAVDPRDPVVAPLLAKPISAAFARTGYVPVGELVTVVGERSALTNPPSMCWASPKGSFIEVGAHNENDDTYVAVDYVHSPEIETLIPGPSMPPTECPTGVVFRADWLH